VGPGVWFHNFNKVIKYISVVVFPHVTLHTKKFRAWMPKGWGTCLPRGTENICIYAYKLTFKPCKIIFTGRPRVFRSENMLSKHNFKV
jgi:hypothetical protein